MSMLSSRGRGGRIGKRWRGKSPPAWGGGGEGSGDRQTREGKTPAGGARTARNLGKRVFAIVGRASEDRQVQEMFDGVYQNARAGMSEKENMARAAELLRENARELAISLKQTPNVERRIRQSE